MSHKVGQYDIKMIYTEFGPWFDVFADIPYEGTFRKVYIGTITLNEKGQYLSQLKYHEKGHYMFHSLETKKLDEALGFITHEFEMLAQRKPEFIPNLLKEMGIKAE